MLKIGSLPIIEPDKIGEVAATLLKPQFAAMKSKNFSIAPGLLQSFWNNMRNQKFAELALSQFLALCIGDIEKTKTKDTYSAPPYMNSILSALLNISITFGDVFNKEAFTPYIEKIYSFNIPDVTIVLAKIQYYLTTKLTFRNMIDGLLSDQKNKLLNELTRTLLMLKMLRFLNNATFEEAEPLFNDLKAKLDCSVNFTESIIILHFIQLILTCFPGKFTVYLDQCLPFIVTFLAKPMPVSRMAHDIGAEIKRELQYPGASYYQRLQDISSMNVAFDGAIPVLFDQRASIFTNYCYSLSTKFQNIQSCFINFAKFFVQNTLRTTKDLSIDRLINIINTLSFDEESINSIKTKYKIKEDIPPEQVISSKALQPLIFPLNMCRLSLNFQPNAAMLTPLDTNTYMFMTPMPALLNRTFVDATIARATQLADETSIVNQPILVAGDDLIISSVLQGLVSTMLDKSKQLSRVFFTIYLLPIDDTSVNELANSIAQRDPIYASFVRSAFTGAAATAPTHNEESTADFPPIIERTSNTSNNVYFSDPSPLNQIQFVIQHYLTFARNAVLVNIWMAELVTDNDPTKTIIVPWMTSIHLGDIFAGQTIVKSPEVHPKSVFKMCVTEVMRGTEVMEKEKLTSLSVWNVGGDSNVKPSDNWVFLEWTNKKFELTESNRRPKFADKITSKLVTDWKLEATEKSPPFSVIIDQRVYGPLKSIRITKMNDPYQPNEQLKLRFATFQLCN